MQDTGKDREDPADLKYEVLQHYRDSGEFYASFSFVGQVCSSLVFGFSGKSKRDLDKIK